jgi:hypothetical protein
MTEGHTHPVTCRTTGVYLKHAVSRMCFAGEEDDFPEVDLIRQSADSPE